MGIPIIGAKKDEVTLPSGVVVPKEVAVEMSPFAIGERFALKGIWFAVVDVTERTIVLEITGSLTGAERRRRKGKKKKNGK